MGHIVLIESPFFSVLLAKIFSQYSIARHQQWQYQIHIQIIYKHSHCKRLGIHLECALHWYHQKIAQVDWSAQKKLHVKSILSWLKDAGCKFRDWDRWQTIQKEIGGECAQTYKDLKVVTVIRVYFVGCMINHLPYFSNSFSTYLSLTSAKGPEQWSK